MARRTGLSREDLHRNALEVGSTLIAEHGLAKFSMRQIAKEIGYTVGTLYNVFKNQDDLLLQINAMTLTKLYKFIGLDLNKKLLGVDVIHHIANRYFTFAKQNYLLWHTLFEYNLKEEESLPQWYLDKIESLIKVSEQALSDFDLSRTQIQCTSRALWASIHGICALSLAGKLALTKSNPAEELMHDLINKYCMSLNKK